MTLSERIAQRAGRAGWPMCRCGLRHEGAAWTPALGWHDAAPLPDASPFTRRALAGQLPAKDRTAY